MIVWNFFSNSFVRLFGSIDAVVSCIIEPLLCSFLIYFRTSQTCKSNSYRQNVSWGLIQVDTTFDIPLYTHDNFEINKKWKSMRSVQSLGLAGSQLCTWWVSTPSLELHVIMANRRTQARRKADGKTLAMKRIEVSGTHPGVIGFRHVLSCLTFSW